MADNKLHTDQELFALLRQGDKQGFTMLYDRYVPMLLRHAIDMLHDEDQAQDVVQDVFQMLWEKATALEVHTSVSAFLYTSTRYRVLKQIRHGKVVNQYAAHLQAVMEEGLESTDEMIGEKELMKKIEAGLSRLPKKMREVFEMSRFQELSHKEIAGKLNLSEHTVKRQVSNALQIMRESLGKGLSIFI